MWSGNLVFLAVFYALEEVLISGLKLLVAQFHVATSRQIDAKGA